MPRSKSRTGKSSTNNPENTSSVPEVVAASSAKSPENGKTKAELEIVKSSAKPSVVPFSLEEEIRLRAYELYKQRGPAIGSETDDWLIAEREILERYQEHRA